MDDQNSKNGPLQGSKSKRPYAKPEMRSSELFERYSLTCGPQANTRPPCGTVHQSVN